MSGPPAAGSAPAREAAAPGGLLPEGAAEAPGDRAKRKTAEATAAAATARAQLAALAAMRDYAQLRSSDQVLLLTEPELWDTMASNWARPGEETITQIVDDWTGPDLSACVHRLDLPVIYTKPNSAKQMRASVVKAVLAHAAAHPRLFKPEGSDDDQEEEEEND